MLVHAGPQSVTLVLRHVDDVENGVAPLRIKALGGEADLSLARVIEPPPSREPGVSRILVASAEHDQTITMTTTLTAPRGAECVMLAYDVSTLERRRVSGAIAAGGVAQTCSSGPKLTQSNPTR